MRLADLMEDVVSETSADATALAATARTHGGRIRRRRRLAATLGGAGTVAAIVVGGALLAPAGSPAPSPAAPPASTPPTADSPSATADTPPPEPQGGQVELDGRTTVAVLRDLVSGVSEGPATGFGGQGSRHETYGELTLTPSGEGPGVVGVNVQGLRILAGESRTCQAYMTDCTVRTLPDGDVLRLYSDPPVPTADGDGLRRVAEVLSPRRDLRVVVAATNGFDLPSNQWDVTRPTTVLTDAQLEAVARNGIWGFRVPERYAEAGRALAPYEDFDASIEAPSSHVPEGSDHPSPPSGLVPSESPSPG